MGKIHYISGGARSGKSSFAERVAFNSEKKKIYIATAQCFDEEMKKRKEMHKKQRGDDWITIEVYKNISSHLSLYSRSVLNVLP